MKTFELTVRVVEEGEDAKDAWENARADLGRKVAGGTFDEAKDITPGAETPGAMTNKEYVDDEGAKCPACKSTDLQGDSIHIEATHAYQPVACGNCGASWVDEYDLTGYAELEKE